MKNLINQTLSFLIIVGLMASGCGKDEASNNRNNSFLDIAGNDNSNLWNNLKSRHQCEQNSTGRISDLVFSLNPQGNQSSLYITGALTSRGDISGSPAGAFVGMNPQSKDLLYIQKITNGNTVTYIVIVSLCNWYQTLNIRDSYGNITGTRKQFFIGGDSALSGFSLTYASLALSPITNCPIGNVLDSWISFSSSNYGNQNIPTRFASMNACANQ